MNVAWLNAEFPIDHDSQPCRLERLRQARRRTRLSPGNDTGGGSVCIALAAQYPVRSLAEPNANSAGHAHTVAVENTGKQTSQISIVPTTIGPNRLGLISPVTVGAAIESRKFGQQRGLRLGVTEVPRLLGIKVIDSVTIDVCFPTWPTINLQWLALHVKRRRMMTA